MNTYKVQTNQFFFIYKYVAIKHWLSVVLFLTLVAYQSVSLSELAPATNILGMSPLSPSSEESEEGFLERFSSGAFPGQPPRNVTKKSRSVGESQWIPRHKSANRINKTHKKGKSSFPFSVPNTGKIGVILGKYDFVIDRVNDKQSENAKTRVANRPKETNANKNKLDLIIYHGDIDERVPLSPSLDIHNEPTDFNIDLSETGIVVRYLW